MQPAPTKSSAVVDIHIESGPIAEIRENFWLQYTSIYEQYRLN